MIEFDVDMGYLLEYNELDCVVLNDENGEHDPMEFVPSITCKDTRESRWFHCSVCGYGISDVYEDKDSDISGQPKFCMNCGAKVVDA